MQFPVTIHIGNSAVLLHAILEPIAFFAGFRYFLYLKRKNGDAVDSENRTWIIIAAIFGALLGSRLVGGLENPAQLQKTGNVLLHFYTNKTVLGGLLGGLFAVEVIKKIIGEKKASGDLFVYPIMLALIMGRIGCFSMGIFEETYGLPSSLPVAMDLGDHLPRHPVALYEIIFLLMLWPLIHAIHRRFLLVNGARFKIFMIAYFIFRFFLDFIKPVHPLYAELSSIQLSCLAGLLWYIRYLVNPRKLLEAPVVHSTNVYA